MLDNHDRLDKQLHAEHYTDTPCGSLNLKTMQAEYCGFDCPRLKARMTSGDDPAKPVNTWPPPDVVLS